MLLPGGLAQAAGKGGRVGVDGLHILQGQLQGQSGRDIRQGRQSTDRLEQEGRGFFERVDDGFHALAEQEKRIRIIDAARSVEQVWAELREKVDEVLEQWQGI